MNNSSPHIHGRKEQSELLDRTLRDIAFTDYRRAAAHYVERRKAATRVVNTNIGSVLVAGVDDEEVR